MEGLHQYRCLFISTKPNQDRTIMGIRIPLTSYEGRLRTLSERMPLCGEQRNSGQMVEPVQSGFGFFQAMQLDDGDDLFHGDLLVVEAGVCFTQFGFDEETILRSVQLSGVQPFNYFGEPAVAAPRLYWTCFKVRAIAAKYDSPVI